MIVNDMITLARTQGNVTEWQIDDSQMLIYANIIYHDVENAVIEWVNEDFFRDIFTTDTVENQNEYTFQESTATQDGTKKIKRLEIKYKSTDTYAQLLDRNDINNFNFTKDYLENTITQQNWFYEIKDSSVFVYPVPDTAVTDWLKAHVIIALKDLVIWWAESTIFPWHSELRQFHQLIVQGMLSWVYWQKQELDKQQTALALYEEAKQDMVDALSDRTDHFLEQQLPESNYFKS